MSIKHWMSAPIAVATLFASQLLLAGSVLAAENNDRLDPRNDASNKNILTNIILGRQHQKVNILKTL